MTNWKEKVYKTKEIDFKLITIPRSKVLKRDNYTCQSCRKRLSANNLSIHHIIPRKENGSNTMDNLITLCYSCHDIIELAEPIIRTKQEILYHKLSLDIIDNDINNLGSDCDNSKNWRKWVYGGIKRQ